MMNREKKAWQKTLQEYLGDASVTSPISSRFDPPPISDRFDHRIETSHLPGFEFRFSTSTFFQIIDLEKQVVAGYFEGAVRVAPEYQGRGLTPELYVLIDEAEAEDRESWLLTPSSFGARKAAHRRHVERALVAGKAVPEEVRSQYVFSDDGRLRLREDYTAAQCNADYDLRRCIAKTEEFRTKSASYSHLTINLDDPVTFRNVLESDPVSRRWGAEFVLDLHSEIGGELLCTRAMREDGRCKEMAVQILKDGQVIDALGVRSMEGSQDDLRYRNEQLFVDGGFFFETVEIEPEVRTATRDEVRSFMSEMDGYYDLHGPDTCALELMERARAQILEIHRPAEPTI